MIAGPRSTPRSLVLALGASVALHLAVLMNISPQTTRQARSPGAIALRLVPPPGKLNGPQANVKPRTPSPPATPPRRKTPDSVATAQAQPPVVELPPSAPLSGGTSDVAIDLRVREVVVTSPSIYGLAEKYDGATSILPYGWSDDFDKPPQATSMSRTQYPAGAQGDGLVLVRAQVSAEGLIEDPVVLCGSDPFEEAAMQSVPAWTFAPPTSRGKPTRGWLLLEFVFLRGNTAENFDPSLADFALAAMRAACAAKLAALTR